MEILRIHHASRLRRARPIESVTAAFHGGMLAHREPPVELLPSRSLRLLRSEPGARRQQDGEPIERVLLFDAPGVSIPLRSARSVDGPNAWSLDAPLPDSLALISPRALVRLGRDPASRGALAALLSCIGLEPCLAEAADLSAPSTVLAIEPQRTESDPKKQAEGLPDSVFQVALNQRVELSLPSGMTVKGTILAMDASTVTFSTELDGNVIVIQRPDIAGIRLLEGAKEPVAGSSQPSPSQSSLVTPFSEADGDDWVSPDHQALVDQAELSTRSGLNWKAYLAYRDALELSSPTRAQVVAEEIERIQWRMRKIGLGLWIPGTVLTVAGFGMIPSLWVYGGVTLHVVGIPMLVVGAVMHARANKVRQELPSLKRRFTKRTRWNGGLSWSF